MKITKNVWHDHDGGPCPVDGDFTGKLLVIQKRYGLFDVFRDPFKLINWRHGFMGSKTHPTDIVRYMVIDRPEKSAGVGG